MTVQENMRQGLQDLADKVGAGAYGQDNDVDMLALEDDLRELTELVEDDDDESDGD